MEIYPFDKTAGDVLQPEDVSSIQAQGITIRSGNKILTLAVTEEREIDDFDEIKRDLELQYNKRYNELVNRFDEYKALMRDTLNAEKEKLEDERHKLERRMSEVSQLPNITAEHQQMGLSVALGWDGCSLLWQFKTVYAPTSVNNRRIEPAFAKRLITPIIIEVQTNGNHKVLDIRVRKIIGGEKFQHYHGFSDDSDCWGDFSFSGRDAETPEQVIELCKEASFILETINEFSLARRNPTGLSRFDTIKKHLLPEEETADEVKVTNPRHRRSGVTESDNSFADNVWST